jgi:hypothetical protein
MGKIADKLRRLLNIKAAIKEALFYVGQEVADKFEDYADAIRNVCNVPFENLGYSEDEAKRFNEFIRIAYKAGKFNYDTILKYPDPKNAPSIAKHLFFDVNSKSLNDSWKNYLATYANIKGRILFLATKITDKQTNVSGDNFSFFKFSWYSYIDSDTTEVTDGRSLFTDCSQLMFLRFNAENMKTMKNIMANNQIGKDNRLRTIFISGLGTHPECNELFLKYINLWGEEHDDDPFSKNQARQSLTDTLLTNSFDRASAGYSVFTITLNQRTFSQLTEEEIEAITNKGYTITV